MAAPIVHFEITGKDGKKLQDFYSKLFDWKIDANNPMNYGLVPAEGPGSAGIGGGIGGSQPGAPGHITVYAEVDDLQSYLDNVEKLGGKTVVPPTEIPGMVTFALFHDPEGNLFGLVKR